MSVTELITKKPRKLYDTAYPGLFPRQQSESQAWGMSGNELKKILERPKKSIVSYKIEWYDERNVSE